jgi:ribosomal protein S18 acetylase RimI-like enzyme
MTEPVLRIVRALPEETRDVLCRTLSTRDGDEMEAEAHATLLMHHAASLRIPMDRHWWCIRGDAPVSACTCLESPGRTAMLFLQSAGKSDTGIDAAAQLVTAVTEEERGRDIALLQCLLPPEDSATELALRRAGFRHLADLLYLETDLDSRHRRRMPETRAVGEALNWEHYRDAQSSEWEALVDSTYHGTLDCPGLSGLRTLGDVLAGYRATGRFDPKRWLLARINRQAVGCILLMESVLQPIWEVIYMGVHADFRRRGIGAALLAQGLDIAHRAGVPKVRLAVDAANQPAIKMYAAAGFEEVMRRRAFILSLLTSLPTA